MTREEAINVFRNIVPIESNEEYAKNITEAIDMAIESLQFVEHFDLLKEYQSLQEVVRCKDCKWHMNDYMREWCGKLSGHPGMKADDFCSYGERKGGEEK